MRKFILFIYLIGISLSWAKEPIKLTLEEAITIALRDNREILIKEEDLKKAKEKLREARAGIFPKISLGSSISETLDYYDKNTTNFSNQLSLKQSLYTGGKTLGNIKETKYRIEMNQASLNKTILETVYTVKKAFFTLLLAGEYAKLNELILANTKNHFKVVSERYNNGQASESELIKLQQAMASVEHIFLTSLNQIEGAKMNLRNLLNLEKSIDIEPEGKFIYEPKEIAFDEVYIKALKERPELSFYEAQEKIDKLQKETARAEILPSVYASWDYYINRSNAPQAISKDWESHQTIGIVLTWPIFDGFATQAKISQAEIDLKETQLLKEKTIMDIASELKDAYLELNNALTKLKAKDTEIKFYEDNLRIINDKYKMGIASSLDLEDAKLGFEISNFNLKEAIYDYLLAKARMERAIGEIK
ncbi:MAG: TolC family protein [Candidatus Omnitrophica bacterium]|nr:TolC family protein [Candidatus Omnitrophota bacterium]